MFFPRLKLGKLAVSCFGDRRRSECSSPITSKLVATNLGRMNDAVVDPSGFKGATVRIVTFNSLAGIIGKHRTSFLL